MAVQQQINKFIQGIGASPGIIIGKAYLLERFKVRLPQKQINPEQVEEEVQRFFNAIQESRNQLEEIKEKILDTEVRKHSFILDVHLMILNDEMLLQDTVDSLAAETGDFYELIIDDSHLVDRRRIFLRLEQREQFRIVAPGMKRSVLDRYRRGRGMVPEGSHREFRFERGGNPFERFLRFHFPVYRAWGEDLDEGEPFFL